MSLRDEILDAVPASAREGILKLALDHNIVDPNDPTWAMVALAWSATQAASTSRQTLDAALDTAAKIPDAIYSSTVAAGADLKSGVAQAIEAKTTEAGAALVQVIGVAASKGAADLTAAAAGLERVGQEHGQVFVEQWKASLARAIERQARSALAWKLASGWGTVAAIMILMMALGAGLGLGGALVEHKLITTPYLQYRRAATGGRPVVRFSGAGPIYKAQDCPSQDTCLAVPN
jgi:hypothetical protein